MKKYMFLLAAPLLWTACTHDALSEAEDYAEPKLIEVTAYGDLPGQVQTKFDFDMVDKEDGKYLQGKWQSGDMLNVTDGEGNCYPFEIESLSADSRSAVFKCNAFPDVNSKEYYAVYPYTLLPYGSETWGNAEGEISEYTPYSTWDGTKYVIDKSKARLQFVNLKGGVDYKTVMWAKATYNHAQPLSFEFKYLTSLMRVFIVVPDAQLPTIPENPTAAQLQTSIKFNATEGLCGYATLDLKTGGVTPYNTTTSLEMFSVDFAYNASAETNKKFGLVLPLYFNVLSDKTVKGLSIEFTIFGTTYKGDIASEWTFEGGKFYYTTVTVHKEATP